MTAEFSIPSDEAYRTLLKVLPANQRWFSFDVRMKDVRAGKATKFGMALWNYRANTVTNNGYDLTIIQDPATETYWYRVAKGNADKRSRNRTSLWNALLILGKMEEPIPMQGILKDIKTHKCAADYIFDIVDIQMESDDSAIWLRLDVPGGDLGTKAVSLPLPSMLPKLENKRQNIPEESYIDVLEAAIRGGYDGASPSEILREIWARGPQHAVFRQALKERWKYQCAVHGVECNGQLRASHIVPWSQDELLRGDVNNGLLLSVPLDNLFDQRLITFDDTGALLISSKLSKVFNVNYLGRSASINLAG